MNLSTSEISELKEHARNLRRHLLFMMNRSKSSHIGACYSIIEILTLLYFKVMNIDPKNPNMKERDYFLLSKAHASAAFYATLAERGFFDLKLLDGYYVDGGTLPGHLDRTAVPGVENSGGSLGHGLSLASGIAYSNRLKGIDRSQVFALVGDGECNEGSIWEAAMLASHLKLSNLTVIVDFNKIQSYGNTHDVIAQHQMADRWSSFGWETVEVEDGHNFEQLWQALQKKSEAPRALVLHTVKGKGVSFMENQLAWHYKSPNEEQLKLALQELGYS